LIRWNHNPEQGAPRAERFPFSSVADEVGLAIPESSKWVIETGFVAEAAEWEAARRAAALRQRQRVPPQHFKDPRFTFRAESRSRFAKYGLPPAAARTGA